jgi:hypothetical protein
LSAVLPAAAAHPVAGVVFQRPDGPAVAGVALIGVCSAASVWLDLRSAAEDARAQRLAADGVAE